MICEIVDNVDGHFCWQCGWSLLLTFSSCLSVLCAGQKAWYLKVSSSFMLNEAKMVVCGYCLWLKWPAMKMNNETLKWLACSAAHLDAKSFWWWCCCLRYSCIVSLNPTSTPQQGIWSCQCLLARNWALDKSYSSDNNNSSKVSVTKLGCSQSGQWGWVGVTHLVLVMHSLLSPTRLYIFIYIFFFLIMQLKSFCDVFFPIYYFLDCIQHLFCK